MRIFLFLTIFPSLFLEIIGNFTILCKAFFSIKPFFLNFVIAFALIQCLRNLRSNLTISGPVHIPPPSPTPSPALFPELRIKPRGKRRTYGKVFPGASSPLHLYDRKIYPISAVALRENRRNYPEENIVVIPARWCY